MASDNSVYTTSATDYDGDTTETIPSADSNYYSAHSDTIRLVNPSPSPNPNATQNDDQKSYNPSIIEDDIEQKEAHSNQQKHHRKRSGLLCYVFALVVLCVCHCYFVH